MRTFKKPNREQLLMLMEVCLDTYAPEGSPVRIIDELVDQLNTEDIEKTYDLESEKGNRPFHPKTMIKVALYAINNCRFSLRKMEHDTAYNLSYRWLTGNETIDHSTMGKFLARFCDELSELFSRVVEIGVKHNLIGFETLNIDTVKLRANASYKQFRTRDGITKEQKKLRAHMKELIERSGGEAEQEERKIARERLNKLRAAKEELQERIEAKSEGKSEKEADKIADNERINITDPGCSLVQQANGETNSGYAITVASDGENDMITHFDIQEGGGDSSYLLPVIQGSRETTGESHDTVNADSGFSSIENLEQLEEEGQKALIPYRHYEVEMLGKESKGDYDRSHFRYNSKKDTYTCPEGKCLKKVATAVVKGRKQYRYANASECKGCSKNSECTKGKYRIISRDENEELKESMRIDLSKEKNKKIYAMRAHAAEAPSGHIKHNLKFRMFMRKGLRKVRMEISLLYMLHNIMKIGTTICHSTG